MIILDLARKLFWTAACMVGLHQYRFMPWDWHKAVSQGDWICRHCYKERPEWLRRLKIWASY